MVWWLAFSLPLVYSGPLDGAGASIEHLSGINAAAVALIFSFTFQGPRAFFFVAQSLFLAFALGAAVGDPRDFWSKTSAALFVAAFGVYFLRVSRTRETLTLERLETSRDRALALRGKIGDLVDSSEAARERLLGPLTRGLSFYSVKSSPERLGFEERSLGPVLTIETLVSEARRSLLQFQKNWATKASAGPVRFVFFPPVTGTEMSTLAAGDVNTLVAGIGTCLNLALESLPEAGPRRERREGVVRLSIRVGLRVVEIAVEDNGRGTLGVVGATELVEKLTGLRRFAESHGGKLERFARLGVGARTVIELPLRASARDLQYGVLPATEYDQISEEATATAPHA
ncbi:MAG: ATP-binding protein [Bdellovibrionales bacterium]|nr:ATP-binding protein [Bdellovibrionales bacterium]